MTEGEIKQKALSLGFDACGIAPAVQPLSKDSARCAEWVRQGMNGGMAYMERRVGPCELLPGARSVVVCLMNYYTAERGLDGVARYAWGADYHYIMWERLRLLAEELGLERFAVTCDTQPVMERALAQRAGLGWIGRNNMLVNPRFGSYTFIGVLITELELLHDTPMAERCGRCRRCIDSCPTGALSDHCVDARHCLSYRTIESKEPLTADEARHGWAFGCDVCQDVCPWNKRFAHEGGHDEFKPQKIDIETISNSQLRRLRSPLCRASLTKLKNNYRLCISNRQSS